MSKLIPLLFSLLILNSCSDTQHTDLILTDVSIVDVENGKVIQNQLIAISGNKILVTDDASNLGNYRSEQIISLNGKYVMPGLWDNHIHFRGGNELIEANQNLLPLLLAFGITTVRDGGGDITTAIQNWNDLVRKDELDGPKIFTP
ncbi:MAG TPA: amidohydrolase, partial [Balneola sp.]|nr:amidohydrolase [Balneola sp.]